MKRKGFEPVDEKPVAVPVKFQRPPGEVDRLRTMMKNLIVEVQQSPENETLEESLDFEIDDDHEPFSQGETRYMKEEFFLRENEKARKISLRRSEGAKLKRKFKRGYEKRGVDGARADGDARGDGGVSKERSSRASEAGAESGGERGVREAGERGSRAGGEDAES